MLSDGIFLEEDTGSAVLDGDECDDPSVVPRAIW